MCDNSEKIEKQEAKDQVILTAKRVAILYQSFAETLQEELGEEKSKEIILKAIWFYYKRLCQKRQRPGPGSSLS